MPMAFSLGKKMALRTLTEQWMDLWWVGMATSLKKFWELNSAKNLETFGLQSRQKLNDFKLINLIDKPGKAVGTMVLAALLGPVDGHPEGRTVQEILVVC